MKKVFKTDNNNFNRDSHSKALLATEKGDYKQRKARLQEQKLLGKRVGDLEQKIDSIESKLDTIINLL